jgi:hypothetical protein
MMRSGSSYLSQSELVLTFGLGPQPQDSTIEIRWPSGQTDRIPNVAADQTITVLEGGGITAARPYSRTSMTPTRRAQVAREP